MPVLSRRGQLAIAAVVDVALHARQAPVAAKALAARHDLPPRHLEPLLQTLVRAGVLKGLRGPRGGYDLARDPHELTCGQIVRAAMVLAEDELDRTPAFVASVVMPAVAAAEELFFAELERVTVADLCEAAEAAEPPPRLAVG